MSEGTRKKVIFGVLIVAVIWGYNNLKSDSKEKAPRKRADVTTSAPAATPTVNEVAPNAAAPKLVNIEKKALETWGKDPFRVERSGQQSTRKPSRVRKWQLSGILFNSQAPVAIINNQQVRTGDMVDNAKVIKIDRKAVQLEHNGTKMTITVTKG